MHFEICVCLGWRVVWDGVCVWGGVGFWMECVLGWLGVWNDVCVWVGVWACLIVGWDVCLGVGLEVARARRCCYKILFI